MNVITLLREVAELTERVYSFGHGPRAYSNLDEKNASLTLFTRQGEDRQFPQVWVHPVNITEDYTKSGALMPEYSVIFTVGDQVDFSANPEKLENVLGTVNEIRREIILRISKHASFARYIGEINAEPIYHALNKNLVGYLCRFKLTLKETVPVPC